MPKEEAVAQHVQVAVGGLVRHVGVECLLVGRLDGLRQWVYMVFAFFNQFVPGAPGRLVIIGLAVLRVNPDPARIDESRRYYERELFGEKFDFTRKRHFDRFQIRALTDVPPPGSGI